MKYNERPYKRKQEGKDNIQNQVISNICIEQVLNTIKDPRIPKKNIHVQCNLISILTVK